MKTIELFIFQKIMKEYKYNIKYIININYIYNFIFIVP